MAALLLMCSILIVVVFQLILNQKTLQKLTKQIREIDEKNNREILATKTDTFDKMELLKIQTLNTIDNSTVKLNEAISEQSKYVNLEIKVIFDNIVKLIVHNKTELFIELENNSLKSKDFIDASALKLLSELQSHFNINNTQIANVLNELKQTIESGFTKQDESSLKKMESIEDKFQKVISEIKSPLTLD